MDTQERQLYIDRMKAFLTWLEENPDIRFPDDMLMFNIYGCTKDELVQAVKAVGEVTKHFNGNLVWLTSHPVEGIRLDFNSSRDIVCERVVTGKKQVDRQVIPAVPEKVIEAHEVEIVEWRCSPLLEETEKAEAAA